jgi:micrococcal nuclease
MIIKCLSVLFGIILFAPSQQHQPQITIPGKVIAVTDGDTFKLLNTSNEIIVIRLNGIDAPEKGQEFWRQSKTKLSALLLNTPVKVIKKGRDKYGRTIGDVFTANGLSINEELVKVGLAWHFIKYSHSPQLAAAEQIARATKLGLWQQATPIAPWDFRKRKKKT